MFSETVQGGVSLYYEPHCDYDAESLRGIGSVDIVITPGVNQELLNFPLVRFVALIAAGMQPVSKKKVGSTPLASPH